MVYLFDSFLKKTLFTCSIVLDIVTNANHRDCSSSSSNDDEDGGMKRPKRAKKKKAGSLFF
jgi:hypothetical protein